MITEILVRLNFFVLGLMIMLRWLAINTVSLYGIQSTLKKYLDSSKIIRTLEEPFYSKSISWYLYKSINLLGSRVSLSGLGADELFGGYDYYNTERYPRGLFKEIKAKTNEEKKKHDKHFLIHHHHRS